MECKFLLLSFLFLSLGCAKVSNDGKASRSLNSAGIIGGAEVVASDEISQTTVAVYDRAHKGLCTGSLLSENLVLTAAHCAVETTPDALVILFGRTLAGVKPVLRAVSDFRIHPSYLVTLKKLASNPNLTLDQVKDEGDLAILRFEGGLPAGFKPAHLLADAKALVNGAAVELAGFGISDGDTHKGSGTLRKAEVKLADAQFSKTEVLFDQRNKEGACHGDSGGPAFLKSQGQLLLFGVTSRGYQDDRNDCIQYSIYTNILAQVAFVQKASRELSR